jgi:hypothetical protein
LLGFNRSLTDGSGVNQATIALKGALVAATAYVAVDLSSGTDPFGTRGDGIPSTTGLAGAMIKLLAVENTSTSGTLTLSASGSNGLTGIFSTASTNYEGVRILPQGLFVWYAPTGGSAINAAGERNLYIAAASSGTNCTVLVGLG